MPPQVNARLVKVTGQGTADDWDRAAAAGAVKWENPSLELNAYYRERVDRISTGDRVDVLVRRTLFVDTDLADRLELDTDDVVELVNDAGVTVRSPARTVARSRLAGVPGPLQTTRIDLEDG